MLEASLATAIAKVLSRSLLETVGLPPTALQLAQVPIDHVLGRTERSASRKTIEGLAKVVASELLAFPGALEDNAGSATSAANTLLDVLSSAQLSGTRLIELELDPTLIAQALREAGMRHLEGAGAERRGHVERAIVKQIDLILDCLSHVVLRHTDLWEAGDIGHARILAIYEDI
jgi:hypothetical protein